MTPRRNSKGQFVAANYRYNVRDSKGRFVGASKRRAATKLRRDKYGRFVSRSRSR